MGLLDLSIVTIVIPEIDGARRAVYGAVVGGQRLRAGDGGLDHPCGQAGDLIGRKRVFAGGMAMFAIASIACGMAPSAGWLIAFRALQGIGGAAMVTLSLALISHILPPGRRQLGWMIWSATGGLALAAGPSLGGVLTEYASWRWVFIVNAPIA
jgi:MFS family permease